MRLGPIPLKVHKLRLSNLSVRDAFIVGLPIVLLVVGAFWLAYQFVRPAPPSTFVMSTGSQNGAYYAFAEKYREHLRKHSIEIELQTSAGAVENIERLRNETSTVDAGLSQAGILRTEETNGLVSLGAAFHEPVWVFYRSRRPLDRIGDLAGKRISIGSIGSGTRQLALEILRANGIDGSPTLLLDLAAEPAAVALLTGKIDAILSLQRPKRVSSSPCSMRRTCDCSVFRAPRPIHDYSRISAP